MKKGSTLSVCQCINQCSLTLSFLFVNFTANLRCVAVYGFSGETFENRQKIIQGKCTLTRQHCIVVV